VKVKIVFLDIDGVLVNRKSLLFASGMRAAGNADCVAALNRITDETGAFIVVSSTWRMAGLMQIKEILKSWGVKAEVLGLAPDLTRRRGAIYTATERGDEIQEWLDTSIYPVESFVILDDDSDMKHLLNRLVRTKFEVGLTEQDATRAISFLCEKETPLLTTA